MNEAVRTGFYPKDLFILLVKNRLVADWQIQNQKNARKFHSYFWVFEKSDKKNRILNFAKPLDKQEVLCYNNSRNEILILFTKENRYERQ